MPNSETMQALSEVPIPVWIGAGLLGLAFTREVARKIGKRANWGCEEDGCDKNWKDGWNHNASHTDHTKNDTYNEPSRGKFLCIDHHQPQHESLAGHAEDTGLTESQNNWAITMLARVARRWRE